MTMTDAVSKYTGMYRNNAGFDIEMHGANAYRLYSEVIGMDLHCLAWSSTGADAHVTAHYVGIPPGNTAYPAQVSGNIQHNGATQPYMHACLFNIMGIMGCSCPSRAREAERGPASDDRDPGGMGSWARGNSDLGPLTLHSPFFSILETA